MPETPGSPAPLDVFQNNLLTMGDALEGLVGQTDSAAGRMHGIWQSFVGGLAGIMQQAYGYLQRLNPFAVFSPSLVDNTKGGARAMLGIWDGHSGNLLRVMMKSYDAMTYLDPTARHSPSILDNVVSGYKQMSDVEKRALQDKWAMFQKVYSRQIALVKEFYEGGGSMHAVYDRDVHSNAVMGSKFISSPTGLNENDWTGMIRRLQDMMGFSNNESPHALIEMIKGLIGTTGNAPQSALTPRSGGGRGLSTPDPAQMLPGQYNGQAAQYGANTHSALINALVMQVEQAKTLTNSVAAMASYIPQLSLQTQAALTTPSDMQFSFNIGNVRSDEDIQLLAQKAASEFAKMQWRGR